LINSHLPGLSSWQVGKDEKNKKYDEKPKIL